MVKIRLQRTGKKHEVHYRIVAIDSRLKGTSRYLAKIGYYNPRVNPSILTFDKDALKKWMEQGAQLSDTVHDLLVKEGVIEQSKKRTFVVKQRIKAAKESKKQVEEGADKPAAAPTTEVKPEEESSEKQPDAKATESASKPEDKPAEEENKDKKELPKEAKEESKEEKQPSEPQKDSSGEEKTK
ncbi:30S ribosomal protein S16 [Candidatus Dojkabacteria bacterium]|nr:30S ribosomal protein S16 [Candidatus Dojkabacteria bacterium]